MSSTRNLERGWYGLQFFRELIPIYPVYAVMMTESGITPLDLSLLFIVWSGTVVVLEVPLGVLGDRMPRKLLVLLSQLLKAVAYSMWLAFPNFWGFMAGFVCWGISHTMLSGTIDALLYEGLAEHGETLRFARVYGRGAALAEVGVASALLIGGLLSDRFGYAPVLVLSSIGPLMAAVFAWRLLPDSKVHEASRRESYLHTLQTGWDHAIQTRVIAYVIVLFAGVGTFYGVYEEYVGPFLREREFSLTMIGVVTALYQGCRAAGMWLAHRLPRFPLRRLTPAYLVGALFLTLVPLGGDVAMVVLLSMFVIVFAVAEIILETELQHAIDSHARATVTSVVSMAREIVGMLYYLIIGLLATATSWHEMTVSLGIACMGLTVIVMLVGFRWRV